ncbi:MAG TPA: MFS transporter [Thermomicrobiales bacterium]
MTNDRRLPVRRRLDRPNEAGSAESPAPGNGLRGVLRNGPFLRLWLAQAISQTANNMVNFALLLRVRGIIEIHDVRSANTAVSLVILAFSLPSVLFGPIAGVVADRYNRRMVMAVTNLLRAVAVICFLIIQPGWHLTTILIAHYVVTFLFGIAGQFFAPAQGASIPQLVSRTQLMHANALFNLTFTGAQLAGFATFGPVLVKIIGVEWLFAVTVVFFLAAMGLVMTLPPLEATSGAWALEPMHPMQRLLSNVKEGLVFILQDPLLMRAITYLTIAATTFLMVAALGPEFVSDVVGLPKEDIGYVVGPAGVGVFVGVFLVTRLTQRFERSSIIDWALAAAGIALACLAISKDFLNFVWIGGDAPAGLITTTTAVLAAILGICNAFILVPAQTLLQERSHEQIRARVYATFFTISNTVSFVPIFFAAAFADLFGVIQVLLVVAAIIGAFGALSVLRRKQAEAARWEAIRTRHRQGPETLTAEER